MPDSPADGDVFRVAIPRRQSVRMVQGRGYLVLRGDVTLVQLPMAAGRVATVSS